MGLERSETVVPIAKNISNATLHRLAPGVSHPPAILARLNPEIQGSSAMASLLEQLRSMTTVVADTGDINSIQKFQPQDSTTNPSLIAAAAQKAEYQEIVDDVLKQA